MQNQGNQTQQQDNSKNNPNLAPEAMQGTDDTQSEFSVNEIRAERRDDEKTEGDSVADSSNETDAAATQSEFSVQERNRNS